jgi:hypothetical protein
MQDSRRGVETGSNEEVMVATRESSIERLDGKNVGIFQKN